MNKEFYDKSLDPSEIMASIQLLDRGIIAKPDMRDKLRESGYLDDQRDDQAIDDDIANEGLL
jgi:hypothetical protein